MAKAIITIEDIDLEKGTVRTDVQIAGTMLDDGHVTAAHFFGAFIQNGMTDPKFLAQVWNFAEDLMQQNAHGRLMNPEQRVTAESDDTAATEAA